MLIKAPLPGWRVELDHRGGYSVQLINLEGFCRGSKMTLTIAIKKYTLKETKGVVLVQLPFFLLSVKFVMVFC